MLYTAISLGARCDTAFQIKRSGFGRSGYPLDWIKSAQFQAVTKLIEIRFKGFFALEDLDRRGDYVANKRWGFHYIHDFVKDDLSTFEQVKVKFDRRIKRFLEVLDGTDPIAFIRHDSANEKEILELDQVLQRFYPQLPYKIVLINRSLAFAKLSEMGRISSYLMPGPDPMFRWQGDDSSWDKVFSHLLLKPQEGGFISNSLALISMNCDIDKTVKLL